MLLNGVRQCICKYSKIQERVRWIGDEIKSKKKIIKVEENENILKEKLEMLREDAFLLDPNNKEIEVPSNLRSSDEPSTEKIEEIKQKMMEVIKKYPKQETTEYQRAKSIAKMPSYADKQSRDLAAQRPWNGKESPYEITSRLKQESIKIKKVGRVEENSLGSKSKLNRLDNAREKVLDYRLSKHIEIDSEEERKKKERKEWGEMYKERLLGPTVLISDTFTGVDNTIKSLADQRIMEAQRRGDFKNIHRGKPFEKGFTANSAYIDRTEYHLNKIMKGQDAIPPWIETQGSVQNEIEQFRNELDRRWSLRAVLLIKKLYPKADDVQLLKLAGKLASDTSFKSKQWEEEQKNGSLRFEVNKLNDRIRGYNLQAPSSSQKIYLDTDKELVQCYNRVNPRLSDVMKQYGIKKDNREESIDNKKQGRLFQSIFSGGPEIPQYTKIPQIKMDSLGSTFLKMFKRHK
ncbi:hypothetical protein HII12_000708 [Brettanomyces bruxellensis]|uniref:DnaJ homologue subfamily C member 28 conserved domain-containing protein n=1 Tax=Dekkera bruxellensis TaxID=5007 RepID=A0A8H6EZ08_DEKBR|nr:hypothetical protein HII12_000708 [Brettanomyces bruxellensis]